MEATALEQKTEIPEGFMEYRVSVVEKKLDDMGQDIRDLRTSISNLDLKFDSRIDKLESKLESEIGKLDLKLDLSIGKLDSRMDKLDSRLTKIDDRLWVLMIGVTLSILVPIFFLFAAFITSNLRILAH